MLRVLRSALRGCGFTIFVFCTIRDGGVDFCLFSSSDAFRPVSQVQGFVYMPARRPNNDKRLCLLWTANRILFSWRDTTLRSRVKHGMTGSFLDCFVALLLAMTIWRWVRRDPHVRFALWGWHCLLCLVMRPCDAVSGHGMTVFFGLLRRFAPRNDDLGLYAVLRLPRFAHNDDLALSEDRSSRSRSLYWAERMCSLRMTLFVMFGNATLRCRVGAWDDGVFWIASSLCSSQRRFYAG